MTRNGSFLISVMLGYGFINSVVFWTSYYDISMFEVKTPKSPTARYPPAKVTLQQDIESRTSPSTKQALSSPLVLNKGKSIYEERLELARSVCEAYKNVSRWKQFIPTGQIWSYGYPKGLHYCIVPKVGCTYWKRIFRFLNNVIPKIKNISKPSDIPRYFVHYASPKTIPITKVKDHARTELLSGGKIMFSRDPYSRLWSAYIDKFHLPDFWKNFAKNVMTFARHNATRTEITCPKSVTFQEFLTFVTGTNTLNEHWIPIYRICSPCHVNYDIIGHLDTFSNDTKYILNRYGHRNLIEKIESNTRVRQETSMLIEYNFSLEKKIGKGCFKKLDVAKRLWKAFQYNGYIHKGTRFPQKLNMTIFNMNPISEFSKHLDVVLDNQWRKGVELKTQKLEFMSKAYKAVSKDVLQKLKDIFRLDFELFGYELEPFEIYGERA